MGVAKEVVKGGAKAGKKIVETIESLVGANLKDAKRKDGQPSQEETR